MFHTEALRFNVDSFPLCHHFFLCFYEKACKASRQTELQKGHKRFQEETGHTDCPLVHREREVAARRVGKKEITEILHILKGSVLSSMIV